MPAVGVAHLPQDARLLGARRRRLLDDLAESRSPHQLALRHHVSRATVSHHLGVLREAGLVEAQRAGRFVYYRRTARAEAFLDG